ncbi:MAG: Eco57I restriction-modification methylase domain-containing protein [Anaerolineae bacterium]|nr:Eco57I restriction-modification methylase domain-containing protein [Anaerolineae bacterium]
MTSPVQSPLVGISHLNHGLFSDYYLDEIVPRQLEWDHDLFAQAKQVLAQLQALRSRLQPDTLDEAQLEALWVRPVLDALGHHYAVQVKIRYRDHGYRKPDYLLVRTAEEGRALTSDIYRPEDLWHVLAVVDAKRWGSHLDQSAPGQRNPSQQIDEYLRYSERTWGILTDGRIWRLYERESSKYNTYYAVDLDHLLAQDNADAFLYFYAFFRQAAFTGDWLQRVLAGSEEFAQKLTDKLEDEVYEALEQIAQGFLEYRRNRLEPDAATLRQIYEQSLVLLYRLLFIFYAESREILPLNANDDYTKQRSLSTIKRAVAQKIEFPNGIDPDGSEFYSRLLDLFFVIDSGAARYDLPPYNGRLFSDLEHPFLREKFVGDAHLIPALDKLARVTVTEGRQEKRVFVDYRDLEVRHLGAIYEKLLEYDLDVATEPLTLKNGKYVPAVGDAALVKQPGQVYLRTGNHERKITGSYYTPDYIVRFIVEKTLEPLLTEITERYARLDEEGQWQVHDPEGLRRAVLAINVLDPATGSGHFVVDAVAYIAEWLRGLALRPADLVATQEDELVYWKRQAASACIYALDINPLAVELAKLSMWLTTLAKGRPLSFLDHHIRVGNTLVGTSIFEISDDLADEKRRRGLARQQVREQVTGQLNMFSEADFVDSVRSAVAEMAQIEATVPETVGAVKAQEAHYARLKERMTTWQQAADVWTARAFGLDLMQAQWEAVRGLTTSGQTSPEVRQIVAQAEQIAEEYRFFHWELAFPEIFFAADGQPKENPGFDAVIGNPPYVRQERIQPIKPFLQMKYDVYSGTADLFLYFYERGLYFLKPEHRLGYITSGTYMNSHSAKAFRQFIHTNAGLEWVANFGENQPFRGAEMVYPTIVVLRRGEPQETFRNLFVDGTVPYARLGDTVEQGEWSDSLSEVTSLDEWRFQPAELSDLYKKVATKYQTLQEQVNGQIFRGLVTGLNEAFVIDEDIRHRLVSEHPSSSQLIKPIVRGQDLRPWYQTNNETYLVWAYQGIPIEDFPAIKAHLQKYQAPLASRWEPSRGQIEWYELRPCYYYSEFERTKIMWAEISKLPRFSMDNQGLYTNNKCYFISSDSYSLLGVVQSRVAWFCISQVATPLRLRAGLWQYQLFSQFVERLPIPALSVQQESDLAAIAEEITILARQRYRFHEAMRHRIQADLGQGDKLNTKLTEWWMLADGADLRGEVQKAFKTDIPLRDRGEWERFLAEQKGEHQRLTDAIIALEIRLNAIVYDAFDLTPEERDLIERTTKYPYGEV